MDEQRFDDVTRSFAGNLPRRQALGALGGAAAALLGLRHLAAQDAGDMGSGLATPVAGSGKDGAVGPLACVPDGEKKCKKNADCCSGKCDKDKKKCKSSGGGGGKCLSNLEYDTRWGSFGTNNDQFKQPLYIAFDGNDRLYTTDSNNYRVKITSYTGKFDSTFGSNGSGTNSSKFLKPTGVAIGKNSNGKQLLYVADAAQNAVKRFDMDGNWKNSWCPSGCNVTLQLNSPNGLATDKAGNVYIADTANNRIRVVNSNGTVLFDIKDTPNQFATTLNGPQGVAVINNKNGSSIYVADTNNDRIAQFDLDGNFIKAVGGTGSGDTNFRGPRGIAVAPCGYVWVADTDNNRVTVFTGGLNFKAKHSGNSKFPSSGLNKPIGIAVDSNNNVWVVDSGNAQVILDTAIS